MDDFRRLHSSCHIQNRRSAQKPSLDIGLLAYDGNDNRDIHRFCYCSKVEIRNRRIEHNTHRSLALHILGKSDGAQALCRAAADAAEHRNIGCFDNGIADRLLWRKRIYGKNCIRVTVSNNREIRCKHEGFDPPAVDDNPARFIDCLRHFQYSVAKIALHPGDKRLRCEVSEVCHHLCPFQLFACISYRHFGQRIRMFPFPFGTRSGALHSLQR